MRTSIKVAVLVLFTVATPLLAEEKSKPSKEELIRTIWAGWKARQAQVKTLVCDAKVETFYSKGYMSDMWVPGQTEESKEVIPAEDQRDKDQPCSWAIDFAAQRVRKEYRLMSRYVVGDRRELHPEYGLHLFTDGKYRLFHPRGTIPQILTGSATFCSDVTQYDRPSDLLFSFDDLPLMWLAGGVSGQTVLPTEMQLLDDVSRFTFRGEAQWRGHDCVVLTVQEQRSPTAVREFWVDPRPPYLIYYCRPREGNRVNWQLETEYREQGGRLVPSGWSYTGYNHPGKSIYKLTYSVQNLEINTPLPPELFEKKLEPGQLVNNVENNEFLEVDSKGNLVPWEGSRGTNRLLRHFILAGEILLAAFVLAWWFFRRRAASRRARS